jgi:hypothetical protein
VQSQLDLTTTPFHHKRNAKTFMSSTSTSRTLKKLHRVSDLTTGRTHDYLVKTLRSNFSLAQKPFILNLPDPVHSPSNLSVQHATELKRKTECERSRAVSSPELQPLNPPSSAEILLKWAAQCDRPVCRAYKHSPYNTVHSQRNIPSITPHPSIRHEDEEEVGNANNSSNIRATFARLVVDDHAKFCESLEEAYYSTLDTSSVRGSRFIKRSAGRMSATEPTKDSNISCPSPAVAQKLICTRIAT